MPLSAARSVEYREIMGQHAVLRPVEGRMEIVDYSFKDEALPVPECCLKQWIPQGDRGVESATAETIHLVW